MLGKPVRLSAVLPAALLAIVTLLVFWALQDYGPESAIRRFRDAALNNDLAALAQVCEQNVNDPNVQHLAFRVVQLERAGAKSKILLMVRRPAWVEAEVQYTLPNGIEGRTVWIVVLQNRVWRVDASGTGQYFRRTLNL